MNEVMRLLLVVIILGFQFFLSTRNNVYWGGIIPALLVILMAYFVITERTELLHTILITGVGLLFLLAEWGKGRKELQKRRKKELNKMRTQDI
ncbi:hypothetical protein MUN89_02790 [Halobacillus salinarum]|uniref:Uncharacterized protein n=1 Tax=Halobacillus salinarum TaxID=2932257 RepID=A0ABY4ELE6_9BACI|nr:hypothetical protein [Halobacillus salinarum]UOQ44896.1 hypothetical protein MUN89_02790 [Halobacillus salinarum]